MMLLEYKNTYVSNVKVLIIPMYIELKLIIPNCVKNQKTAKKTIILNVRLV